MNSSSILDADTPGLLAAFEQMFRELTRNPTLLLFIFGALLGLALARRVPVLRTLVSIASFLVMGVLLFFVVQQQGLLNPGFAGWAEKFGGPVQQIVGDEVRIKQSRDGHFWARVKLNGVERRLLIDRGATVTALSAGTAKAAGVEYMADPLPVMIRTANGTVTARTGKVRNVRFGTIKAVDLGVVVSPALGDFDVLGMNFLSRLKGWRVEEGVLILTPHHPRPETNA